MFTKLVVVDAKGHLLGRLASYVAKELLRGQRVSIVRCEQILISGSLYRNKLRIMDFRHKRMSTNPKKGPIHQRAPSRIVWRTIRGMLAHTTPLGSAALGRLKCFDGVPLSMNRKKRVVVPDALKCVRMRPGSKFCKLAEAAIVCGWTKSDLLNNLETGRLSRNKEWHLQRVKLNTERRNKINNNNEIKKINEELAKYGY